MVAYKKTSGIAHDLRLVEDDYVADADEILLPGWELPKIESLNDEPSGD